jgi:hypothetical protein
VTALFLKGKPVVCEDVEVLAAVVWELEDRLDGTMGEWHCTDSINTEQALKTARTQLLNVLKRNTAKQREEQVLERTAGSKADFDEFNRMMAEREQKLEARLQKEEQETQERQARELAKHEADWAVEPKQRLFNRSPQKVRVLRRQQQLLMNSHRFDEAAQVRGIADRLARAQALEHHYQLQLEFEASRVVLDQKHMEELDTMHQAFEGRRGEFKFIRDKLASRFFNRFKALKAEETLAQDPDRNWTRRHRNDGDQMVKICGTARRGMTPKKPEVMEFNTLSLPPLTVETPARRRNRFRSVGSKAN